MVPPQCTHVQIIHIISKKGENATKSKITGTLKCVGLLNRKRLYWVDHPLLEKCLIAPVGEGLGYRFCQPVPHNRDQRLSLRHRVKEPVPKALVITEKIYARMW